RGNSRVCRAALSGATRSADRRNTSLPIRKYVERGFSGRSAPRNAQCVVRRRRLGPWLQARAGDGGIRRGAAVGWPARRAQILPGLQRRGTEPRCILGLTNFALVDPASVMGCVRMSSRTARLFRIEMLIGFRQKFLDAFAISAVNRNSNTGRKFRLFRILGH